MPSKFGSDVTLTHFRGSSFTYLCSENKVLGTRHFTNRSCLTNMLPRIVVVMAAGAHMMLLIWAVFSSSNDC